MVLEGILPGGISFFLGLSGVLVAATAFAGLVTGPGAALGLWIAVSLVMTLTMRPLLRRYFGGQRSTKLADEDLEAMDQEVPVLEDVTAEAGSIRFRGAVWPARTLEGTLKAGTRARIRYRDNLTWIVAPLPGALRAEEEGPEDLPPAPRNAQRHQER
jgi:membrane protein implicated in regulation of membrane protease activity